MIRLLVLVVLLLPTTLEAKNDYTIPNRCVYTQRYFTMVILRGPPPELVRFVNIYCSIKYHPVGNPHQNPFTVRTAYEQMIESTEDGYMSFYVGMPVEHNIVSRALTLYEMDLATRTDGICEKPLWRTQDVLDSGDE